MNALFYTAGVEGAFKQVAEHKAWLVKQAAIVYRSTGHPAQAQANDALRWLRLFHLLNRRPLHVRAVHYKGKHTRPHPRQGRLTDNLSPAAPDSRSRGGHQCGKAISALSPRGGQPIPAHDTRAIQQAGIQKETPEVI